MHGEQLGYPGDHSGAEGGHRGESAGDDRDYERAANVHEGDEEDGKRGPERGAEVLSRPVEPEPPPEPVRWMLIGDVGGGGRGGRPMGRPNAGAADPDPPRVG